MSERSGRFGAVPSTCYALTTVGVLGHAYLLYDPPDAGNGLTTLPLVVFLLLATGGSLLRESDVVGSSLRDGLLRNRRVFGICAGVWAIAHAVTKATLSLGIQPEGMLAHVKRPEIMAASVALLIMAALLGTSNNWSQRKLGAWWRRIHRLVWLVPGIALIHGHEASEHFTVEQEMNLPVLIPLMIIVLAPIWLWVRRRNHARARRVAYLLTGAAFAGALIFLLDEGPAVSILQD